MAHMVYSAIANAVRSGQLPEPFTKDALVAINVLSAFTRPTLWLREYRSCRCINLIRSFH